MTETPRCKAVAAAIEPTPSSAMLKITATILFVAAAVLPAAPQTAPPTGQKFTLSGNMLRGYAGVQRNLLEAAELMPEEHYAFKPTPETRPYGQLVAHIALSQFGGCAALKGETNPKASDKEETPRSKAELVALLKASTAYCDPVLNALTDEGMVQLTKVGANEAARGLFLASTNTHGNEMYGTMAVYLRLKGLVPPTTARQNQQAPPKQETAPREVVDRFFAAYRAQDVDALTTVLATDVSFEDPTFRLKAEGVEAIRKMGLELRRTYKDLRVDVHSMTVDGESVATEQTISATMLRRDGQSRQISVRGASFFRVRNGRIYRWTDYFDYQTFSEQTRNGTN